MLAGKEEGIVKAIFLDAVGLIRLQDFPPEDVVDRNNLVTMDLMEWVKVWVDARMSVINGWFCST